MRLKDQLRICISTPGPEKLSGIPILIWGPPGGGKTAIIKELGRDMNLHVESVLLSVRDPSDVAGLPVLTDDGVKLHPPVWARKLNEMKEGILFFDELSCAAPSVQAAALRIVSERIVGEFELSPGIRIVAAANPTEQAAGGWELSPPMANRFVHVNFDGPQTDQWCDWLSGAPQKDKKAKKFDNEKWRECFAKAKGIVTSFIGRHSAMLGPNVPSEGSLASRAWPSPRSWEMATRILAGSEVLGLDNSILLEGTIGKGAAKEFATFEFYKDLPSPRDLLRGTVEFEHNPKRLDFSLAVLTSVAAYTIEYPDLAPAAWKILGGIAKKAADVAVPAARTLIKSNLFNCIESTEALAKLQPLLAKANIQI